MTGTAREVFGAMLRSRRERAGLSLRLIADRTKVSSWMFAALEEGDISKWPQGVYRRSFFRQYAGAIGLNVEDTFAEFERLFADELGADRDAEAREEPLAAPGRLESRAVRAVTAIREWLTRKLSIA